MKLIPLLVIISHIVHNVTAFVIDKDQKSFVRFTDDGLYKATLNAFENEWQKTFIDGSKWFY